MSSLALEIVGLWKSYGRAPVLQGLDLSIASDAVIFGVVGPNGAGKTTLFGLLCGCLRPDRGSIALDGRMLARTARRPGEFAILAQDARFVSGVKLKVLLAYYARLQGFGAQAATVEALRALALVGLEGAAAASPDELSHGMRKLLGIAVGMLCLAKTRSAAAHGASKLRAPKMTMPWHLPIAVTEIRVVRVLGKQAGQAPQRPHAFPARSNQSMAKKDI